MAIKGNVVRYGSLAIAFHWIAAAAIFAMLGTGFTAALSADVQKAALLRVHVPLGLLVLALTIARIVWRFFDTRPQNPPGQPRWQAFAARSVHSLLYLVVIVMGVSGIGLLVLSGAAAVLFLGAPGPLPDFSAFPPIFAHVGGAFLLVSLLCMHIGAALYHQFIRRDGLLSRMGVG